MYGPDLPATGGGVSAASLVWGISSNNFLLIGFAIIIAALTIYSFVRLRRGEKRTLQ